MSELTNKTQFVQPKRYQLNGFEADRDEHVKAMHREAQWLVNDLLNRFGKPRWLSMLGISGVGKTHLARAIADLVRKFRPKMFTQFWKWSKVCSMLRDGCMI